MLPLQVNYIYIINMYPVSDSMLVRVSNNQRDDQPP